jgi:hypothetical protein
MWVPGGLIFLAALTVVFFRWQAAAATTSRCAP